jgi:hypothetical protein
MIPSVPGQPVLDLRLLVQLANTTTINANKAKIKNIFFITKNFRLKNYYCNSKLYCKDKVPSVNGEIG